MAGSLVQKLSKAQSNRFAGGEVIPEIPEEETLLDVTFNELSSRNTTLALGVCLTPLTGQQDLEIVIITPDGEQTIKRSYGGHPRNGPTWAANISLELLGQELLKLMA